MDLNEYPSPSPSQMHMFDFLAPNHDQNQNQNHLVMESGSESQPSEPTTPPPPPPQSKKRSSSTITGADKNSNGTGGDGGEPPRWLCQVEGCSEDGSGTTHFKDYHRRHRVCPAHTRAASVTLRGSGTSGPNTLSRFCQQCSKFHALHEFDEDRRSCRRRLQRHNRRRRTNNRHNVASENAPFSLTGFSPDEAKAVVVALLRIISLFESARPDPSRDQELISRLLKSLATSYLSFDISDLLQKSTAHTHNPGLSSPSDKNATAVNASDNRVRDFDLNTSVFQVGNDIEPEPEDEHENVVGDFENISPNFSQPSCNDSDSPSLPSRASNGDSQGRTGKVIFKLFGKDLADSPPNLHPEILTWLSHCPIEMESYMKPGCIILSFYLCLTNSAWHELAHNLAYWIERLTFIPDHDFWRTGWVYVTLQDQMSFMYNGRLVLQGPLISKSPSQFQLLSISPVAVSSAANVTFCLKGYDLSRINTRLFVAYDGDYLVQGCVQEFAEKTGETVPDRPEVECIRFSCTIPASSGRGFIEIEEYDLRDFSFPFIVTDEATCVEIRELESEIDLISNQQNEAMEFLQEMGWLLRRAHRRSDAATYPAAFSVVRYRLLISFAINHEWCSVLKKLLDILFNEDIHLDDCSAEEFILREGLLFKTVRKKSKPLVAFLLRYQVCSQDCQKRYLFTPDMVGPCTNDISFITPLHLVATIDGAESVLDALTDDPGKIGIKAWMTSRGGDRRNKTPAELARERAHKSYIQLIQHKIDLISKNAKGDTGSPDASGSLIGHFDIEKGYPYCKRCTQQQQVAHRPAMSGFLVHRPAILTLVCIAAVCVCVSLILKTPPFVKYIKGPFLWDSLEKGTM